MEQPQHESKLRKWRKAKGFTLAFCAGEVGTSKPVWQAWETGRRRPGAIFMPRVRAFTGEEICADDFFPSLDAAA